MHFFAPSQTRQKNAPALKTIVLNQEVFFPWANARLFYRTLQRGWAPPYVSSTWFPRSSSNTPTSPPLFIDYRSLAFVPVTGDGARRAGLVCSQRAWALSIAVAVYSTAGESGKEPACVLRGSVHPGTPHQEAPLFIDCSRAP